MAFKLMRELVFKWPVKVMEPDPESPGQYVEKTFTAIMAIIDPEKVKASNEKRLQILSENAIEKDFAKLKKLQARLAKHDEEAMREVLRGWKTCSTRTTSRFPTMPRPSAWSMASTASGSPCRRPMPKRSARTGHAWETEGSGRALGASSPRPRRSVPTGRHSAVRRRAVRPDGRDPQDQAQGT